MSVKHDASGRRWVEVEVEVPGTPEEVWEAIATGPGVTSWFVPTERVDEGGKPKRFVSQFGSGPEMESVAEVDDWDPPHRFSAESPALGPEGPQIATEWIVEARSGGTCVVRVVHSLFADGDEWDEQLGGFESGWPDFFRILRLYLTHFRGQVGVPIQLMRLLDAPAAEVWGTVSGALGLEGAAEGERLSTEDSAPPLAGEVETAGASEQWGQVLLRLDRPAPGVAHLFALAMQGRTYLGVRFYFYGEGAAAVAAREEPRWEEWLAERFPAASGGEAAC